ncbi:MAG: hypothetical protein LPH21_12540 [Shewanella sp.]|nr:hypothetical protein [Shewanella sp.]
MKNGPFDIRIEIPPSALDYIIENVVSRLATYGSNPENNATESKTAELPPTPEPIEAPGDPTEGESPSFPSKEAFIHYAHRALAKFRDNDIDDSVIKSVIDDLGYDNLYDVPTKMREIFKNNIDSILDQVAKTKNASDQ